MVDKIKIAQEIVNRGKVGSLPDEKQAIIESLLSRGILTAPKPTSGAMDAEIRPVSRAEGIISDVAETLSRPFRGTDIQQPIRAGVTSVGEVIADPVGSAKAVGEVLAEAPAETVLSTAGSIAGGRVGGTGLSFALGSAGGTVGRELDEFLANVTSGAIGKENQQDLFTNALMSTGFQALGEVGGRMVVAPILEKAARLSNAFKTTQPNVETLLTASDVSSQAADKTIKDALSASRFLEQKTGTPILTRPEITQGASLSAREGVLKQTKGTSPFHTAVSKREDAMVGALRDFGKDAKSIESFGKEAKDVFVKYIDEFRNQIQKNTDTLTSKPVLDTPVSVTGMGDALKRMFTQGRFVDLPDTTIKRATAVIDKQLSGEKVPYSNLRKLETELDSIVQEFKTAGSGTGGDFFAKYIDDVVVPSVDHAIDSTRIVANNENLESLVKSRIGERVAKKALGDALSETKVLRQVGTSEQVQDFKAMSGIDIARKIGDSADSMAVVNKIIGGQRPDLLPEMKTQFRRQIANKVSKNGQISKSALENILVKDGVPQDEFLIEAVGEDMLRHLKAVNVVKGAIDADRQKGGAVVRIRASGGLPAAVAANVDSVLAFILDMEPKSATSISKIMTDKLFDADGAERFLMLSRTPLGSGEAYDILVPMVRAAAQTAGERVTIPTKDEYVGQFDQTEE